MAVMPALTYNPDVRENAIYGSPSKRTTKRECFRVESVPSIERLMTAAEAEMDEMRNKGKETDSAEEGEEDDDIAAAAATHTYKKSQYWCKEVDEKLGLAGADPYGLLEMEDKRWRATPDELRKAYRRLVLQHHPDKKASEEAVKSAEKKGKKKKKGGEGDEGVEAPVDVSKEGGGEEGDEGDAEAEEDEDSEFKLLSAAWDLLSNPESRRAYDSIDNFNDYLPVTFLPKKSGRTFFQVFAAPFARQSKFSTERNVPQLGDADTPYEQVAKFYKFWFAFSSWRDFSLLAEHDYKEAEDREERRWMQRQNKNMTDRIKKDERARVQAFVQLANEHDPRVIAYKEKLAAEKLAVKQAKEAALRAEKDAKEAALRQKENEQKEQQAAAEAAKAGEKAAAADSKREKERLRSALKKARKELKALGEGAWAARAADLDVVAAVLSIDELNSLMATLGGGESDEATAALDTAVKAAMKQ